MHARLARGRAPAFGRNGDLSVVHGSRCGMPMFSRKNRFKDKGVA
jgi:hypothetical protein